MPPPHERHDYTTVHDVGSPSNPMRFLDQKLLHEFLRRNELFIDELFPPNSSSIGTLEKEADLDYNNIKRKRPSELVSNGKPFFTVDGMSRFDNKQGSKLGCVDLMRTWILDSCLMDLTGGVDMEFELNEAPAYLWNIMDRASKSQTLIGCDTSRGVMSEGNPVHLVRVLNPWVDTEWNGDWSDE